MSYAPTQKPVMIKSNSAADSQILRAPVMHRHRKTVSTGGGRAWSDAEEAYLIETREHKMPYKHIASQLKKTELACRLHYHQLSFGSKSRRHSQLQITPHDRSSAPPPSQSRPQTPHRQRQRQLPSFSPPASPPETETMDYSPTDAPSQPQPHKPILPKPSPREPHSLRLITHNIDHLHERQPVDLPKLDRLYDAHRLHFWSTIARHYNRALSPATLEDAWRRAHGLAASKLPPTPHGSPQAPSANLSAATDPGKSFTPINSENASIKPTAAPRHNSFAISSLLTEDREVKSPGREKKPEDGEMTVKSEQ